MAPFRSSKPKDILRAGVDHVFVRRYVPDSEKEPAYFGLPGESLLDVIEWRDRIEHAICVHKSEGALDMMRRVALGYSPALQCDFLRGDIDSVLLTGADDDGKDIPDRPFQIVNLDYEGGLIQDPNATRLNAIRDLFRHQSTHERDFVFFLTLGPRGRPGLEISQGLETIRRRLSGYGIDAAETVKWYRQQPNNWQSLKVYVPFVIEMRANAFRYELAAWQAFLYRGTNDVPMLHFATRWTYSTDSVAPDATSLEQLLTAPMYIVTDRILSDPNKPPRPTRASAGP